MEVKKKILFVVTSLNIGGVSTSLRNLVNSLPTSEFDITTILFKEGGEKLLKCNFDYAGKIMRLTSIDQKQSFRENVFLGIYRLFLGGIARFFGHRISYKIMLHHTKKCKKKYDVAISFVQSGPQTSLYGGCNEYVLNRVDADLKISFIHCDYKLYGLDSQYSHSIYNHFDRIAAVSRSVKECFLDCEPSFSKKTFVSTNFHDYNEIIKLANENPYIYDNDCINFITVARFGKEKGHLRMLKIVQHLKELGYRFKWHIVGADEYTASKDFLTLYNQLDVSDVIKFHGKQINPYRYMKNSDFLLIPSYHEAAPMVYEEARCLNLPILTTRTLSADELVAENKIGIVCDNNDAAIESALLEIFQNPNVLNIYKNQKHDFNNDKAYSEFLELLSK